ncbi:HAD family hydrolase, partial [Enterococcus faecium]|uniref:HAD family hydrolase n=1 Tax=Enterococcus faecium TaxID=1352 RepID=UPI0034E94D7B
ATAYREIPQAADKEKQLDGLTIETAETNLTFVCLAIMSDPPRPEIYAAIKKCHNASIKIIMVTGDSSLTAKSIAVKIGLTSDKARVVTGTEL